MKNKGEGQNVVLYGIIFVVILALLFVGPLKGIIVEKLFPFFKNSPGFEDTNYSPSVIGTVRYDIQKDKVEIYDGKDWNNFDKGMEFSAFEQPVVGNDLLPEFRRYYFQGERPVKSIYANKNAIVNVNHIEPESGSISKLYLGNNVAIQQASYVRGTVSLTLFSTNPQGSADTIVGYYLIDSPSKIVFVPIQGISSEAISATTSSLDRAELANKAISWRDSVFAKPIIFNGAEFCAKIIDNRYINVNLNKQGEICDA